VTPAEDYLERWADYRLRLARRCVREGRPDLGVPLYRSLIEEQPREEALVRELLRCYGQTGDLPGLERQMRALEAALRAGYGDDMDPGQAGVAEQPEVETARVYDETKGILAGRHASSR
jgi:hypothetical protein